MTGPTDPGAPDPSLEKTRPSPQPADAMTRQTRDLDETVTTPSGHVEAEDRPRPEIKGIVIEQELGRGGMGVVYRGRQDYLQREVAIKVLLSAGADQAEYAQRFQREARILAQLDHPHIVRCFEAGTTDTGECYLVMELINGTNLRDHLRERGPLSEVDALRVTRAVAQALQHANAKGIIHRDVKPENVLLQVPEDEQVGELAFVPKLADLGLARPQVPGADKGGMNLTMPGMVLGTPTTMAPEQFDDPNGVDFRADIYGLGCVLFESLTGQHAFIGTTFTQLIDAKRSGIIPDPSKSMGSLDRSTVKTVQAFLQPDKDRRPADYDAAIALIDTAITTRVGGTATAGAASGGGKLPLIIGLVAVVAVIVAIVLTSGPDAGDSGEQASPSGPDTTTTTTTTEPPPVIGTDPPPDEHVPAVLQAPTPTAEELAAMQFGAPQSLWGDGYENRLQGWTADKGGWAPSEEVPQAVLAQRSGRLERSLPALPCRITGSVLVVDVGAGAATEFGCYLRDADGAVRGWAAKSLGSITLLSYEQSCDDPDQAEVIGESQSAALAEDTPLAFELIITAGGMQVRLGETDLGILPLPGPGTQLGLFSREGGAQFQDLTIATLASTP